MTDDNPPPHADPGPPEGRRSSAFARARSAALAELTRKPRARPWWRDALAAVLLVLASTAAVLAAGAWLSIDEIDRLSARWLPLALLTIVQVLGVFAAIAPGKAVLRRIAAALAIGAAIAIVAGRGGGHPSMTPAFACSTSHIAVDLVPLTLVLYSMRKFSVTLGRSLLAGVSAAATGAIAGELSCGRGWSHVLIHHVGSGAAIAIACVLLARYRQPETFAP